MGNEQATAAPVTQATATAPVADAPAQTGAPQESAAEAALRRALEVDKAAYEAQGVKFKVVNGGLTKPEEGNAAPADAPATSDTPATPAQPEAQAGAEEFPLPDAAVVEQFLFGTKATPQVDAANAPSAAALEIARRDLEIENLKAQLAARQKQPVATKPVTFEVPEEIRGYYANLFKKPDGTPNPAAVDNLVSALGPLIEAGARQIVESRLGGMQQETVAAQDSEAIFTHTEKAVDAVASQYFANMDGFTKALMEDRLAERMAMFMSVPNSPYRQIDNAMFDPNDRSIPFEKRQKAIAWVAIREARALKAQWAQMTGAQKAAAVQAVAANGGAQGATPNFDPGVGGQPAQVQPQTKPGGKFLLGALALRPRAA